MLASFYKPTGKFLEMQSDATPGTLIANAVNQGYNPKDIEEREINETEFKTILDAEKTPPTKEQQNAPIIAQIEALELKQLRPMRENLLGEKPTDALAAIQDIDAQIKELRSQLV